MFSRKIYVVEENQTTKKKNYMDDISTLPTITSSFLNISDTQNTFYLLNPLKHTWDFPGVIMDDSTKPFWKHSRYIVCETTTCDVGNPLYPTLAY